MAEIESSEIELLKQTVKMLKEQAEIATSENELLKQRMGRLEQTKIIMFPVSIS